MMIQNHILAASTVSQFDSNTQNAQKDNDNSAGGQPNDSDTKREDT